MGPDCRFAEWRRWRSWGLEKAAFRGGGGESHLGGWMRDLTLRLPVEKGGNRDGGKLADKKGLTKNIG